jgi:hypothetical protein
VTDDAARIDKLTQALLHVASELWATRDRQAVLERLLADGGAITPDLIEGYRPDDALAATLTTEREAFIANILGYLAPDD